MFRLIVVLTFLLGLTDGFSQEKDMLICWNSNKLRWTDFKGSIPSRAINNAVTRAECSSKIIVYPMRVNDSTDLYRVKATFNKNKSWTRDTTKYILTHEQLHFDITELYARKIRKMIKESSGKYDSKFEGTVKQLISGRAEEERIYDEETVNGSLKDEQARWSKKVHKELDVLKEFASTSEDCNH